MIETCGKIYNLNTNAEHKTLIKILHTESCYTNCMYVWSMYPKLNPDLKNDESEAL